MTRGGSPPGWSQRRRLPGQSRRELLPRRRGLAVQGARQFRRKQSAGGFNRLPAPHAGVRSAIRAGPRPTNAASARSPHGRSVPTGARKRGPIARDEHGTTQRDRRREDRPGRSLAGSGNEASLSASARATLGRSIVASGRFEHRDPSRRLGRDVSPRLLGDIAIGHKR